MKTFIATLLSVTMVFSSVAVTDKLLKEKSESGIKQCLAVYSQPEDTVDLLVLGTSHVHCGINTAKLWNDYGIAAYDYSSAEQSLWVSYYYLREMCKYQKPKVVVLDFFGPAAFLDNYDYKYYFLDDTLYGMRFSANKLEMMNACFDGKVENWDRYFPSYAGYHDRYDELEEKDLKEAWGADYSSFKGFTPFFKNQENSAPWITTDEAKAPSDKSVKYLKKIIDYTNENGIELYITVIPYTLNVTQQEGIVQEEDARYNWLENYVLELQAQGVSNVYFDYTFKHIGDIGIDFESGADTADGNSHLNYNGSVKFTRYLADDLRSKYGAELLPDHRGDAKYSSWDRHVEEVKKTVEEAGWEWK